MKIESNNLGPASLGEVVGKQAAATEADPGLRQAAADFESLFINQMFQAMRRSVPQSKLFGSGSGEAMFREMLDAEWASNLAKNGGLGIGEVLYRNLSGAEAVVRYGDLKKKAL